MDDRLRTRPRRHGRGLSRIRTATESRERREAAQPALAARYRLDAVDDGGRKSTLFQSGAGSKSTPLAMTVRTDRTLLMFSSGLRSSTTTSARLPASTVPVSRATFITVAGTIVAACSASIGVKPARTYSSI